MENELSLAMCNMIRVLVPLAVLAPLTASANDSVGHLAAGGIELGRTADIEMVSEDLFVSTKEVRVRYVFKNTSPKDIDTLVAFPVPDLPPPSDVSSYTVPDQASENFLEFETSVDGKPVAMSVEKKAMALGVDRTEWLRVASIPLSPYVNAASAALDALPPPQREELVRLGIAHEEMFSDKPDAPMTAHLRPNWTLRSTYYWQQIFPAGKEIAIEHRYVPSVGASAGTMLGSEYADAKALAPYRAKYCLDDEFMRAAARTQKNIKTAEGEALMERRLEYVLTTGANWAGPIRSFRLVVDKGSPMNLVSFCGKGIRKISDTAFEMRAADYWPGENLNVLILEPYRP